MTTLAIQPQLAGVIENAGQRQELARKIQVLSMIKPLEMLPDGTHCTTSMVAEYYGVSVGHIKYLVGKYRDEAVKYGYTVLEGKKLNAYKASANRNKEVLTTTRHLGLFTKQTVLWIGMLVQNSPVAEAVRTLLWKQPDDASVTSPVDVISDRERRDALVIDNVNILNEVGVLPLLPDGTHTTIKAVADFYGVSYTSVANLLNSYRDEFESDGVKLVRHTDVAFDQLRPVLNPKRFSVKLLTRQAVLRLGMLLRNSSVADNVRSRLISKESNEELEVQQAPAPASQQTSDYLQLLEAAHQALGDLIVREKSIRSDVVDLAQYANEKAAITSEKNALENKIKELTAKVEELAPKADKYDTFFNSNGLLTGSVVAKMLGTSVYRLYAFLREQEIFTSGQRSLPRQQYVDEGYFEVKMTFKSNGGLLHPVPIPMFTTKGVDFVTDLVKQKNFQ
jgi:phage antirepressor YoqD-like protein